MPSLTAELLGTLAVVILFLAIAVKVDPVLRARRAANRLARKRRHAAQGCRMCRLEVEAHDLDVRIAAHEVAARAAAAHVEERLAAQRDPRHLIRDDRGDGVVVTALVLVVAIAAAFIYVDPTTTVDTITATLEGVLR